MTLVHCVFHTACMLCGKQFTVRGDVGKHEGAAHRMCGPSQHELNGQQGIGYITVQVKPTFRDFSRKIQKKLVTNF